MERKEKGEINRMNLTNALIKKYQKHQYKKGWLLALMNKIIPLRNIILYFGLTNLLVRMRRDRYGS